MCLKYVIYKNFNRLLLPKTFIVLRQFLRVLPTPRPAIFVTPVYAVQYGQNFFEIFFEFIKGTYKTILQL